MKRIMEIHIQIVNSAFNHTVNSAHTSINFILFIICLKN